MEGRLQDFINNGMRLRVFDCDNPLKPEKDDCLGEKYITMDFLKNENTCQYIEFFSGGIGGGESGVQSTAKGKVVFSVTWDPPGSDEEAPSTWVAGDERVVIGSRPLILRAGFDKRSAEVAKVAPGTRLELHEIRETPDGFRARVRVLCVPMGNAMVHSASSPAEQVIGWITAAHSDGRRRLTRKHLKLDANERRYQLELWSRRTAAERLVPSVTNKDGKEKEGKEKAGPSYAHEIAECKRGIAFAFGGVYPGTLHARGALVKTHQVSYSVGASGKYLMHVGLHQQSAILPGSPFALEVKPGIAHAPSTTLPKDVLPLETVVGTQGRLVIQMCDCMGNKCIEGGAPLDIFVNCSGMPKASLMCKCEDQQDGTFLVTWAGEVSGKYTLELKLQHVHLCGSPTSLLMVPAELEISRCELIAPREAVAGLATNSEPLCDDAPRLEDGKIKS